MVAQDGRLRVAESMGDALALLEIEHHAGVVVEQHVIAVEGAGVLGQGVEVSSRWNQVFKVLNGAHPDEPHWYLSSLGVDPPFQGRGIGGVLLSAWLADVDRSADPAYLETDMEVNLDFYHREGFEPVGELDVLGVRVWCMRRLPRK